MKAYRTFTNQLILVSVTIGCLLLLGLLFKTDAATNGFGIFLEFLLCICYFTNCWIRGLHKLKSYKFFTNQALFVCAVCVALSFLSQIFNMGSIANATYAFSLMFVCGCYVLSGCYTRLMLFLTVMLVISMTLKGITMNADYFSHGIIAICTYVCLEVGSAIKIDVKTFKRISVVFLLTVIILFVFYYLGPLKSSTFANTSAVALNLSNPNAASLWLVCIFILLFYFGLIYRKTLRYIFMICAFGILPIVLATESRNSFLACIFLIGSVIFVKLFKIKKLPNWVLAVLTCLPLIVLFFYMYVIVENIDFWENVLSLNIADKSLDSRQSVWGSALKNFWDCFLIGDYPYYFDSQPHNSLLTVYCRFGVFATIAVCVLIYRTLKKLQENSSIFAVLSLSAVLFTGCFEASVFVGIAGLYLMLLIIPACSSVEQI